MAGSGASPGAPAAQAVGNVHCCMARVHKGETAAEVKGTWHADAVVEEILDSLVEAGASKEVRQGAQHALQWWLDPALYVLSWRPAAVTQMVWHATCRQTTDCGVFASKDWNI